MTEPESVAAVWKTIAYTLGGVTVTLAGAIAKMAHWFMKERLKVAEEYKKLSDRTLKALDRNSDHLRDLYNALNSDDKASRTQFEFNHDTDH